MKILIAGDFCPQFRVSDNFDKENYHEVLGDVKDVISEADYSIVNFECPISKGSEKAIVKVGPNLKCSFNGMKAVKWAGFNGVTLANNHFRDYGNEGCLNTLEACSRLGIDTVGGGNNLEEASRILYKNIGDKRLAIINCCEHEFSIATETAAGSNPLNPIKQYYQIKEAHDIADFVLVIVHGGHEHYQLPGPRMQQTYRFFIDAGADAVINHHQHCYSGHEIYQGKPIFYGLGNFCFDKKKKMKSTWYEGYMVMLMLDNDIRYKIYPYYQCLEDAHVTLLNAEAFNKKLEELNNVIKNQERLLSETNCYYKSCMKQYGSIFEPFRNKLFLILKKKGFLPSFVSRKRKITACNYICCESHRDKLVYYLNYDLL